MTRHHPNTKNVDHFGCLTAVFILLVIVAMGSAAFAVSWSLTKFNPPPPIPGPIAEEIPAPAPAEPDHLLRWGTPEGTVIREGRWCFAFDGQTRCPRWALEYLDLDTLTGDAIRKDRFFADPRIPVEFRPTLEDYENCGYDRGHVAAAGNYGEECDKAATFSLANMTPQNGRLNRGLWKKLEHTVRIRVKADTQVWVLTCPIWRPDVDGGIHTRVIGANHIHVPTHYGKVILVWDKAKEFSMAAWVIRNEYQVADRSLEHFRVPVDDVERWAGLNVFPLLDEPLQKELEGQR